MASQSLTWFRRGDHLEVQLPAHPTDPGALESSLIDLLASPEGAGARVHLVLDDTVDEDHPSAPAVDIAARFGFSPTRTILRLRRQLPVAPDDPGRAGAPQIAVRTFEPADAEAWVEVNNAAFADHPDQGTESLDTLHHRLAEPWFRADGFLVLDDAAQPGRLAGFCWTKVHEATSTDPPVGEIYVIGAHPDHHGHGLGAALVLAGLDHLSARGLSLADLFVEEDNGPARRLYDRLGFHVIGRRRVLAR